MKFGGTSVGTTLALTQLLSITLQERERWTRLLLVVSALEGVTDALIEAAYNAQMGNQRSYRRLVANLRMRHMALIEHIPLGQNERSALQGNVDSLLYEMLDACQRLAENPGESRQVALDSIIGVGEKLAARIVAALLRQNGLRSVAMDATDLIITDKVYGNATPNMELTRARIGAQLIPMMDRAIIPVVTGFIGSTTTGEPTTLGRGGSDYTASTLALCADADEVWIWSDVDGLMSADPREMPSATQIEHLTYDEAADLAYFGVRLLHSRMIEPLRMGQIPLQIRNIYRPQQAGTMVGSSRTNLISGVHAVTSIQALGFQAAQRGPLSLLAARVNETFLSKTGSQAEVMLTSQSSNQSFVCFVVPTSAGIDVTHMLQNAVLEDFRNYPQLAQWTIQPVSVITAVGYEMASIAEMSNVLAVLRAIPVLALTQHLSGSSISVVVEQTYAHGALAQLHELIVQKRVM
jgi:bifunctional aspartokinase / homoserine dehydrogenase 1